MHPEGIGFVPLVVLALVLAMLMLASIAPIPGTQTSTILGKVSGLRMYDNKYGSEPFAIVDLPDGKIATVHLPLSQRCTAGSMIAISDTTVFWGHRYAAGYGQGCAP